MIQARSARLAWLNFLLAVTLSGCGLVGTTPAEQTGSPELDATLAAVVTQTMAGIQTQTPKPALNTLAPERTPSPVPPTATASATAVPLTPTPTPICDQAAAGNPIDVTIGDNTQLRPGQNFTKIWRLQNVGACTWTKSYSASFFYGAQMDAPALISLQRDVPSGEAAEIIIDMVAPLQPGTYQGNWKLRNADGQLFGIGPSGDAPFWVRVVVLQVQTSTPTATLTPTQTPSPSSTPSPSPTATPVILVNGALSMQLNALVDLDNGAANPLSGADLAYQKDAATGFHLLAPQNTALFGLIGSNEPDTALCQTASMSSAPLTLESFSAGTFLCYRTDSNHYGWLRFNAYYAADESVGLDFRTWAVP